MKSRRIGLVADILFVHALALFLPLEARAEPLFGWGENVLEDRFADGDIDEEDRVALQLGGAPARTSTVGPGDGTAASSERGRSLDERGQSWMSIVGIAKQLRSGRNDLGAFVVVGLALDRVALGPIHRLSDPPRPPPPPSALAPPAPPASLPAPAPPAKPPKLLAPALARACVVAALRASGLGTDDTRMDDLITRSRESAWLPETRMRAMRLWTDAAHTTTVASTDTATFYDALGANLVLELRLTWRLDRLLFAGDEATAERVRLERQDARSRLATRTLEVLFAWQRALVQSHEAIAGSPEATESRLRAAEAAATLDVLTAGWFSEGVGAPGSALSQRADP
jgi:hypothetical protein